MYRPEGAILLPFSVLTTSHFPIFAHDATRAEQNFPFAKRVAMTIPNARKKRSDDTG